MDYRYELVKRGGVEHVKLVFDSFSVFGEMDGIWNFSLTSAGKPFDSEVILEPVNPFCEQLPMQPQQDRSLWLTRPRIYFYGTKSFKSTSCRIHVCEKLMGNDGVEYFRTISSLGESHDLLQLLLRIAKNIEPVVREEFLRLSVIKKLEQKSVRMQKSLDKKLKALKDEIDENTEWLTNNNCQMI